MDSDEEWIRHRFAPGEEPTVYTADLCVDVGHEHLQGDRQNNRRIMKANQCSAFAYAIGSSREIQADILSTFPTTWIANGAVLDVFQKRLTRH
jgi:hypothetical protein